MKQIQGRGRKDCEHQFVVYSKPFQTFNTQLMVWVRCELCGRVITEPASLRYEDKVDRDR